MVGILLFLLSLSVVFGSVCEGVDLKRHFPFMPSDVEVLQKREVFGLCELVIRQKPNPPFTLYAGKDFVLVGELIKDGESLSRKSIEKAQEELFSQLVPKLRQVIATTYGNGEKEVFFVSDPDCPFCQGIKAKVKQLADERGYKVHLVWFPLPSHPQAKDKAISFICERRTYEHYLADAYGSSSCEEGKKKVEMALELLSEFVSGTPTFIFGDGRMVVGANPKALEANMK